MCTDGMRLLQKKRRRNIMNYTLIVLLIYAVMMLGATVLMTKKEGNVEKFCVGNRNIGWGISALSIAATWIWAPALFKIGRASCRERVSS